VTEIGQGKQFQPFHRARTLWVLASSPVSRAPAPAPARQKIAYTAQCALRRAHVSKEGIYFHIFTFQAQPPVMPFESVKAGTNLYGTPRNSEGIGYDRGMHTLGNYRLRACNTAYN